MNDEKTADRIVNVKTADRTINEKTSGRPLYIIAGPTACGKTEASLSFAREVGGEIISCDSMQVYRMMDIGSAKIREDERQGIPHHLIDVLDPKEEFNVYTFVKLAKEAAEGIYERGRVPVLTGGTGFYIQAFLYDIDFTENTGDKAYRRELEKLAEDKGAEAISERLKEVDPESWESIDHHNVKRMIRALEFFRETGKKISVHNAEERQKKSPYDFEYYVLTRDRKELYERIDRRVDVMMAEGFLEEVKALKAYGCTPEMTSMQGLGYKQLYRYLLGEYSLKEAVERIKIETRHFAKRQLTWFRREKDAVWIDVSKEDLVDVFKARHQ
ncbi:MAG: tRNA (adenosine(37)-N6)-dimethylallyltransferase MiaA [Lachnospiraceae bacterium]|nr:tRNA (adenosine(37)-N6)-dimethylallyltransferase MiaA [Lachnospiraceae bacterium]